MKTTENETLDEKELRELAELGKTISDGLREDGTAIGSRIRMSLTCDANGTGVPCRTDRLEAVKDMRRLSFAKGRIPPATAALRAAVLRYVAIHDSCDARCTSLRPDRAAFFEKTRKQLRQALGKHFEAPEIQALLERLRARLETIDDEHIRAIDRCDKLALNACGQLGMAVAELHSAGASLEDILAVVRALFALYE